MKALKTFLFVVLAASLASSCHKIDLKDLLGKPEEKEVTKKGLVLSGAQEVPAKMTGASGSMSVSYIKKTKMLYYTISWTGLTGNPVGSHIHGEATRGVNTGVKHDFTSMIPKATSGNFTNSVLVDEVAIKEEGLLKGLYYLNIHTSANPGGEIRGQIEFD